MECLQKSLNFIIVISRPGKVIGKNKIPKMLEVMQNVFYSCSFTLCIYCMQGVYRNKPVKFKTF